MKDKRKRHISKMIRFLMTVLTSVLIVLILIIILMVSRIQGTARVVNYAGLVRGKTQRIIKLEDAGMPQDEMIADVDGHIEGLRFGSEELDLVSLDDKAFQAKMEELDAYFDTLKQEIDLVRQVGYENTNIIQKSETFFSLCDVATGLAETYAQRIATRLGQFEALTIIDIVILIFMILYELFKAFHYAKANRELKSKIYLDEATGLPNKNKCEEILTLEAEQNMAICVFDLNNLRIINNQQGHERGDLYINLFAKSLRNGVDENQFVGRCGGDEFIAFFKNVTKEDVKRNLENIKKECAKCSEIPLSYAAGFAYSNDFSKLTMRELFCQADKNMYIDKNQAKINEATEKRDLILRVIQQLKDKGYNFSDCIYCDAKIDAYFTLRASYSFFLAEDGIYSGAVEQILNELFEENKMEVLTKHLNELVEDVLNMSKLESDHMEIVNEPFDLNYMVEELNSLIDAEVSLQNITYHKHMENVVHTHLIGDALQLRRILVNLLTNAIKYNKSNGTIDTYVREISSDDSKVTFEFEIKDTGIGMSEDYIKNHLFTPFSQAKQDARTRYKGTGLGMSIVKGLVDKLGGSIEVKSEVNVGTQIKVILAYQLDTSNTAKQDTSKLDLKDKRILLVEDNEINMEVAEFYLNAVQANVDKAWNGLEAVEKVKEQPNKYSLILMDIMMPKMNGDEAAKCIRKINPSIPIVAMSAQSEYSIDQTIMNDSISKPIDEQKLNHILSKYVS